MLLLLALVLLAGANTVTSVLKRAPRGQHVRKALRDQHVGKAPRGQHARKTPLSHRRNGGSSSSAIKGASPAAGKKKQQQPTVHTPLFLARILKSNAVYAAQLEKQRALKRANKKRNDVYNACIKACGTNATPGYRKCILKCSPVI